MRSLKADLYDEAFRLWKMIPTNEATDYGPAGHTWRFDSRLGAGEYWAYFRDNLFAVNAFSLRFAQAGCIRYRHTEHLSLTYYEETGLVAQSGAVRSGAISTYVADEGAEYVATYQAGSTTRATSITISPDYYRDYLRERFGDIPDMRRAFALVDGRRDLPELVTLFKQVRAYRGTGMAADLFYEGAVAEALALVMKYAADIERQQTEAEEAGAGGALSAEDNAALDALYAYVRANPAANLTCAELARRACMGQTKLKGAIKTAFGTTPAAFVTQIRMERAVELLESTDLSVAQVAREVGYRKPGAFAEAFRRTTGVVPSACRRKSA